MSRSTGGVGGNIYRYAFIIYKLNQGRRRRKDIPFQREWGTGEARGRRRRRDVPFHRVGGGGKHTSLCQNKNQVPFHRGGGGETRRKDVSFHRRHISLCRKNCLGPFPRRPHVRGNADRHKPLSTHKDDDGDPNCRTSRGGGLTLTPKAVNKGLCLLPLSAMPALCECVSRKPLTSIPRCTKTPVTEEPCPLRRPQTIRKFLLCRCLGAV